MNEKKCKELVGDAYNRRMNAIKRMWSLYKDDPEARTDEGENWSEYGLSFDYVPKGTFDGQKRGYFRYQISYGGPSEEFRFFVDENLEITGCYFWYLDLFDGAKVKVTGKNLSVWEEIWDDFKDIGLLTLKLEEGVIK